MTISNLAIFGLALSICPLVPAFAQEGESREELIDRFVDAIPDDTVTDAEVFEANGFSVETADVKQLDARLRPDGTEFQLLTVEAKGVFQVTIEKGREAATSGSVGIYHRDSREPMVVAVDRDADGRIDYLEYYVLDEDGEGVMNVIDYEADGQADFRLNYREHYNEIWHQDRWYRVENREGTRGIVVEDEFREVDVVDNRPIVR